MQANFVKQDDFESIFGKMSSEESTEQESGFGFGPVENSMFTKKDMSVDPPPSIVPAPTATEEDTKEEEVPAEPNDSLFKPKEEATPTTLPIDYFESRIKEGKFLPFDGDSKLETPEDIDALIELNFEHKISEIKDSVISSTYNGMSEAWRFVAENAKILPRPADLIPLLQGVNNIDTVSELDPEKEVDAETIIRIALKRRGEPAEIVEDQLNTFRDNKTLVSLAKKYQPVLINEENQKIAQFQKQKAIEEQRNLEMISRIHESAVNNIETPFLGKHKLKQEEKAAIYGLIAQPQTGGGYKIFEAIDSLYESNDFETLKEIALLIANKESYRKYLGVSIGAQVGETLMRKLKTTQTANTSFESDEPKPTRQQAKPRPLGTQDSGFGFFKK